MDSDNNIQRKKPETKEHRSESLGDYIKYVDDNRAADGVNLFRGQESNPASFNDCGTV